MTSTSRRADGATRMSQQVRDDAARVGIADARSRLEQLVDEGRIRKVGGSDDPFIVDRSDYLRHSGVLDMTTMRSKAWKATVDPDLLDLVLSRMGFVPDPRQREAIVAAIENPVTFVHGGPGTGKSTVIKAISRYVEAVEPGCEQVVAAFAGKIALTTAAKAGLRGTTLHGLTGAKPGEEDVAPGAIDPGIGTIYVDEAFAVPPGLVHRLLRQSSSETRIVFAGDPAQLPPIGQGRLLHDLLRVGGTPAVALRTSHRLGSDGHLATQAALVAEGRPPKAGPGLEILLAPKGRKRDVDRAKANCAVETVARRGADGRRVVVLTMTRHGECGHEAISRRIAGSDTPEVGHHVIATARHAEGRWRNGQSGTVVEELDGALLVDFGEGPPVWAKAGDPSLAFAYAMSVHRAQGLEYDEAVLVLTRSDLRSLSRQALVSAMTRAPRCTIVTDEGVVERAAMRDEIAERAPITDAIVARRRKP